MSNELQLKITLAKAGLERDAVAAAASIRKQLGTVEADIKLKADDADVKKLDRALGELADETLKTAQQAEFLKKAYNLSDREVEQVIGKMRRLGDETDKTKGSAGGLNGAIAGLAAGAAFAAIDLLTSALQSAGAALLGFIGSTIEVGGANQNLKVAFTTILGSAEAAQQAIADLADFAATTPFELPEVQTAGRQLLAFGFEQEQLTGTLTTLGDIAAGVGTDFGELTEIFGKAKVQGRLFAEDINQLTGRGIPIIAEFASQFGVTEGEVRGLVESGQIGFAELQTAFQNLTSDGGKFGGLMAEQARTIPGQITNIADSFTQLQIKVFDAFEPVIGGALATFKAFLDEVGQNFDGFGPIIEAGERLNLVLSDTPELAESFGEVFGDIANEVVDQLAAILDAVTAFVAEEGNVEAFAGQFEILVDAIAALGTVARVFIGLADGILQFKAAASEIPIIGDNLERFLQFPVPFNLFAEALKAVAEVLVLLKDVAIDAVSGVLDSASKILPVLGPIVDRIQQVLGLLRTRPEAVQPITEGITADLKTAASTLSETRLPAPKADPPGPVEPPEPPDLSPIEDKYKALTAALEVEQDNQIRALVDGGKSREEIEAKEREFLQRRINLNQQKANELRAIDASALDDKGRANLNDTLLGLDQKLASDRLKLSQDNRRANEDAEKARTKAAENAAKDRETVVKNEEKSQRDAEKTAKDRADAEKKRQEEIARAREEQIKTIEAEGLALVRNGQLAIESAETQLQSLDRVGEGLDRQADQLKAQGDLASALGDLQAAINDARTDSLREVIADEDASDSKKRKAASDLLALTEQQFAAEKAQLEQKQALELQAFDLGQQQLALADRRAIREQELGLAKIELQKLEIENERTLAELRGDDRAVQMADRQLSLLDQQTDAQAELIASLQKEAALSQELGQGQRQTLLAQQEQQDIGLANQQRGQARSVDEQVSGVNRSLGRRGDRLVTSADRSLNRELSEAQGALPGLLASARPNPQIQALAGLGSVGSPGAIDLSRFVAPVVQEIQALGSAVNALAASPRQLTVATPDPVRDTSQILSDIARQASQGVNP